MDVTISAPAPGEVLANEYAGSPTSTNPRELYDFEYQVLATNTADTGVNPEYAGLAVKYTISANQLPLSLTIDNDTGLISGTVTDLDQWVPEFEKPEDFVLARDGSNYATYGSALAGSYTAEFTIKAYLDGYENVAYSEVDCSILVVNNYSSDRDQFIRDYTAEYGPTFIVNGELVDANTYIEYQQSIGNFPPLSNV